MRLLEKDSKGQYKKDGSHKVLRTHVIVSDATIEEFEGGFQSSGLLYIVLEGGKPEKEIEVIDIPVVDEEVIGTEGTAITADEIDTPATEAPAKGKK